MSLDDVLVNADTSVEDEFEENIPSKGDPGWHDFVMGKFLPEEFVEKNVPSCDGLRRVVQLLLGNIISSKSRLVESPKFLRQSQDAVSGKSLNLFTPAIVEHEIMIEDRILGTQLTFQDVSSCYFDNTERKFWVHAPETAATKAESRTLRKALGLRKILAEEEVKETDIDLVDHLEDVTSSEIALMKRLADTKKIPLFQFIKDHGFFYDETNLSTMKQHEAREIIAKIQGK